MAKNSITDYSKTAASNTDIQSVDIAEGCLPSGINNAIREIMADLADMNDGTVTLTSPAFTSVDINGGTIDGAVIGGASAAAGTFTTLTASGDLTVDTNTLYVDSTNNRVGIGTSSPQKLLEIASGNSGGDAALDSPTFRIKNTTESADWDAEDVVGTIEYYSTDASGNSPYVTSFIKSVNEQGNGTLPSGALTFGTTTYNASGGAVERLRIDSSGNVGIGTSSPSSELTVSSGASSAAVHSYTQLEIESSSHSALQFSGSTGAEQWIWFADDASSTPVGGITYYHGGPYMAFRVEGSERLRIDSSGNVGIGTTSPDSNVKLDLNSGTNNVPLGVESTDTNVFIAMKDSGTTGTYGTAAVAVGANSDNLLLRAGSAERMRIDSSGNVGIGTSSPSASLEIYGSDDSNNLIVGHNNTDFAVYNDSTVGEIRLKAEDGSGSNFSKFMTFYTQPSGSAATERLRIDSSGNVLAGKTLSNTNTVGVEARSNGQLVATLDGGTAFIANRKTSDGDIAKFMKDGTTVGQIGTTSDDIYIGSGDTALFFDSATDSVKPRNGDGTSRDNAIDLGASAHRFDDIFATNGTIQTSDRNEKQDIEALSEAEQRVAVAAKGLLRNFRWKGSVEEKGDDARIHFGIIAQDLQAAFEAEGLDAGRYAMFINSTWTDEETGEERSRMGVRYNQLLAFIIAAI